MMIGRDVVGAVLGRAGPDDYESSFGNWEGRSSVRNKPRRKMNDADGADRVFFPPEFVPALGHPLVAARGTSTRSRLLTHALYQYLHFTTVLEQTAVLPVTAQLAAGRSGLCLPEAMRRDAFKITTDEAWHAQFSYDFLQEVVRVTGVQPTLPAEPRFVRHLAGVRESIEPSAHALADLLFAVVSETLVSRLLADIPNDKRLPVPVRALVGDHAEDEGRHYAYFQSFLRLLWPKLSSSERHLLGPRVPELVRVFLQPDLTAAARMLRASGFTEDEAARVVADSYSKQERSHELRSAARGTVRVFRDVGALDDPVIFDAFASAGLV